jgi:hypothetical protein
VRHRESGEQLIDALNDDPATTDHKTTPAWRSPHDSAAREREPNDLVMEVRTAVDYGLADPVDAIEMACAATETTAATVTALSHPFALYTPHDAATIASALFLQLQHSAAALTALRRGIEAMAQRGDTDVPDPAGPDQPSNLGNALQQLHHTADDIDQLISRHAPTTIAALAGAGNRAPIPRNAHETLVAVSRLLAEQLDDTAKLLENHDLDDYDPADDDDFGCACAIRISSGSETFLFDRGDHVWCLLRESDGQRLPDGSVTFLTSDTEMRSTPLAAAHPQQLAQDILIHITSTS